LHSAQEIRVTSICTNQHATIGAATADSAMAASQNGFCSCKLAIHKKTNILQIMTKNMKIFIYLIFYYREIAKLDHFMTLSLSYANTVL
jgi:hypothetical protein